MEKGLRTTSIGLLFFHGFHVERDVSLLTKTLFEFVFDGRSSVVNFTQGETSVHANMGFDSDVIAYATRAKIVRLPYIREQLDELQDFLLRIRRQGTLREVAYAGFQ